ncbi:hypothetical protein NPIL_648241 [Nephila pilipes]|uniref:Secreted protein n=1 Tax=Nephila pilipes TaxID=299642 RepID=A0A8X6QLZ4_NEPPI|nr:hypothetical protein NPIL_648241 [Nephila pilipes]
MVIAWFLTALYAVAASTMLMHVPRYEQSIKTFHLENYKYSISLTLQENEGTSYPTSCTCFLCFCYSYSRRIRLSFRSDAVPQPLQKHQVQGRILHQLPQAHLQVLRMMTSEVFFFYNTVLYMSAIDSSFFFCIDS